MQDLLFPPLSCVQVVPAGRPGSVALYINMWCQRSHGLVVFGVNWSVSRMSISIIWNFEEKKSQVMLIISIYLNGVRLWCCLSGEQIQSSCSIMCYIFVCILYRNFFVLFLLPCVYFVLKQIFLAATIIVHQVTSALNRSAFIIFRGLMWTCRFPQLCSVKKWFEVLLLPI